MKALFLLLILVLGFSVLMPRESRYCSLNYEPVCGRDGVTYSNLCFLKNAGMICIHKGVCGVSVAGSGLRC